MRKDAKKQENIRRYILELIIDGNRGIAKKTSGAFGISEMTVYRYLKAETNMDTKELKYLQ